MLPGRFGIAKKIEMITLSNEKPQCRQFISLLVIYAMDR